MSQRQHTANCLCESFGSPGSKNTAEWAQRAGNYGGITVISAARSVKTMSIRSDYNPEMPLDRGAGDIESPQYGHSSDDGVSSPDSVRRQLENILSSEVFLPSPQLCRFLRFIVEQEIAGKGGELKEY